MYIYLLHGIYLLSIAIAALIGFSVYKKVRYEFQPLVQFFIWMILFELVGLFFTNSYPVLQNWITPLQAVAGTFFFCVLSFRCQFFGGKRQIYIIALLVSCAIGFAGYLITGSNLLPWLIVITDIIKLIIGIEAINRALIAESNPSFRKPLLFTGIGLILIAAFSLLPGIFVPMGNVNSQAFLGTAYLIILPFGILANILFIAALLRVPHNKTSSFA